MDCFIISYLGKGGEKQRTRLALHYRQICGLLHQRGVDTIHILAQAYDSTPLITVPKNSLYLDHPRIVYHTSPQVTPGNARNALLEIFYQSNKKWGLFLDNDALIDPRWHGEDIIPIIERNADYLATQMDVLSPMIPRHMPFSDYLEKKEELLKTHCPLQKANHVKGTLFFMRNRVLCGDEPIYFDKKMTNMEDAEFVARVLAAGSSIYLMKSVILADLGCSEEYSTLFDTTDGKSTRTDDWSEVRQMILDRYADVGLTMNDKGTLQWSKIRSPRIFHPVISIPVNGSRARVQTNDEVLADSIF